MRNRLMFVLILVLVFGTVLLAGCVVHVEQDGENKRVVAHFGTCDLRTMEDSEEYVCTTERLEEPVVFTMDWNDMMASVGQEIYNDGQCSIRIFDLVDDENGGYTIFFAADGAYDWEQGSLVTLLSREPEQSDGYIRTSVGDDTYETTHWYVRGQSCNPEGDEFGYSLFPTECYWRGQLPVVQQIMEQGGLITVELVGLQKLTWNRKNG